MGALVRPPVPEDADAIGRLHVRAWQAAYRGVMPDEYLDGLRAADRGEIWRRQIEADNGGLLVIAADRVVGFAAFGPCRDHPDLGELYAMNLDPEMWGRGLGRELLDASTKALTDMGFAEAVLWVVPENERARRLYEGAGWQDDGETRDEEILGVTVHDMRYRRSL